ncbi:nucleotide pyrophosphohydrolase [Chitinibacteraceae bacterium HSL-7]
MNIAELQQRLRDFAAARDWGPYHSPKNLVMAMSVEMAELVEPFQWLSPDEAAVLTRDPEQYTAVADEMADVLLYLVRLADVCGVDLDAAVEAKIAKNAIKHPPKR